MLQVFLAALREALQCSLIAAIVLLYPQSRDGFRSFLAGVLAGLAAGFGLSYLPGLDIPVLSSGSWEYSRHLTEAGLYFLSLAFIIFRAEPQKCLSPLFLSSFGFAVFFFEAGSLGLFAQEAGLENDNLYLSSFLALSGTAAGFVPLVLLKDALRKIHIRTALALPGLFMSAGVLKFAMGGLGEMEPGSILTGLQQGIQGFLEHGIVFVQETLLLTEHPFIHTPLSGLAGFLSGDRTAMSLMVLLVMAPPVLSLIHLLATPDPVVSDMEAGAEKRLATSLFRKDLLKQSVPIIGSFAVLFVLIHAVNLSLNPMFEPDPLPVRESEVEGTLLIPLSGSMGEIADGKLKKYVYYYGDREIIFLAILKPDGTLGVALDECEICDPAPWKKAARGYAQRGGNLVCKYCMTPIAVSTVNRPGGCNPIPVPFSMDEDHIKIPLDELVRIFREASELEKKGSHL